MVLIVEDDPDTAAVLATLLELKDHQALIAGTGAEALALASTQRVDVVLLDVGLPDLDGIAVCRELKNLPDAPLVIAVSGWGRAQDRAAADAAGCDHYCIKPVTFETIENLLAEHGRSPPPAQ
jgi:two-component system, OmpR family, response regulator